MATPSLKKRICRLPEWNFGCREPLLLEHPVLLLMAVPLRQRLNWKQQVMPALEYYRQEHSPQSINSFYSSLYYNLTDGFREWREAAQKLWGRPYWRSAEGLFYLLSYAAQEGGTTSSPEGSTESDWQLLRERFLVPPRDEVIAQVRGLGPNSWTFLCYYLTNHPPERHEQSLAQLFARSYELAPQKEAGEPEEASDKPSATIQRLWLQLLNDGVLRKERLL